jgi:hypothetical protein
MFHLTHEFVVEQSADVDGPEKVQVVENVQRDFEHSLAVADSAAQALHVLESIHASLCINRGINSSRTVISDIQSLAL